MNMPSAALQDSAVYQALYDSYPAVTVAQQGAASGLLNESSTQAALPQLAQGSGFTTAFNSTPDFLRALADSPLGFWLSISIAVAVIVICGLHIFYSGERAGLSLPGTGNDLHR